jgi:hypothetical protein
MPWRALAVSSHTWLYGGDYGPEGGIVATIVLLAGVVCLAGICEKNPQPVNAGAFVADSS